MNMTFYVKVKLIFVETPHPIIRNNVPRVNLPCSALDFALNGEKTVMHQARISEPTETASPPQ